MKRLLLAILILLTPAFRLRADEPSVKGENSAFGLTKVHKLHLKLTAENWKTMQPAGGWRGPPGMGPPREPAKKEEPRKDETKKDEPGKEDAKKDVHRSVFGMEYPIVHGELEHDGKTYKDIGVRFKGNSSYGMAAGRLKRPFKLDFNHYVDDQRFLGLKEISLNNGGPDPTLVREALAYRFFALAEVPCSRTAFVELYLTIPGQYDREYVGLYTMVENVDKTFLKDRFGSSKGMLLKPERMRDLEYLGDDWTAYKDRCQPKTTVKDEQAKRFIALAKLIHKADDDTFHKDISGLLDVDKFLRFLAATTLMSSMDSIIGLGHNYYLYLDPKTNRFSYLPWDEDHAFAAMGMMGTGDQLAQLSLMKPNAGPHKLIERVLGMPEHAEAYRNHCRKLMKSLVEEIDKDLPEVEKAIDDSMKRGVKASEARKEGPGMGPPGGRPGFGPPGGMPRSPELRKFVADRAKSVEDQLEDKSKGYTPVGGFGGKHGPGGPGAMLTGLVLKSADTDKDNKISRKEWLAATGRLFDEADRDKKGALTEGMLEETIKRILPPPPGGGFRGMPGPERFFAHALIKRAGADKEGKVSREFWDKAAEAFFDEIDKDRDGLLDEKELGNGHALLVPPPGGGFPGPAPGGKP